MRTPGWDSGRANRARAASSPDVSADVRPDASPDVTRARNMRWTRSARAWWLAVALVAACLLPGMSGPVLAAPTTHLDNPALTITSATSGPVGANVMLSGQSLPNNRSYQIGVADDASSGTCQSNFAAVAGASPIATDNNGNVTGSFPWPGTANQVGHHYFVCLKGTDHPDDIQQSTNEFQVLADSVPSINMAQAATPTPSPVVGPNGTPLPTVTPIPNGFFVAGEEVTITGQNFLPAGTHVAIYLSGTNTVGPSASTQLPIEGSSDGTTVTDTQGTFRVVVTLPANPLGVSYIHAATTDATDSVPPTLDAFIKFYLNAAPTPTPTPTVTPTPQPQATATPAPTRPAYWGAKRILGVAGLGSLSALLLLVGAMLLVSASRARGGGPFGGP